MVSLAFPFTRNEVRNYVTSSVNELKAWRKAEFSKSASILEYKFNPNLIKDMCTYKEVLRQFLKDLDSPINENHYAYVRNTENAYKELACVLARNKNYKIGQEDIKNARADIDSILTFGLTGNETWPITKEDFEIVIREPEWSNYENGLRQHPRYEEAAREFGYDYLIDEDWREKLTQ